MKRSILLIGLAAPLGIFLLQSRPVSDEVHAAHLAAIADLERTAEDFSSLTTTLESAWASVEDPGENARTLAARVAESPERLSTYMPQGTDSSSQQDPYLDRYEAYTRIVNQTEPLITEFFAEQAVYLESITFIQESGPRIIAEMRRIRMDRAAAETSQLVVGTLAYATGDASVEEFNPRFLLVSLGRDLRIDANMPRQTQTLLDSVTTVLDNKSIIQSKVTQIVLMPIPDNVSRLIQAEEELYRSSLLSVGQGRTLLSIYAVLFVATVGFVMFRRRKGYR